MLKKLTDDKLGELLEVAISEFADKGLENTSMNAIAKRAGVSVGVLYKYYADKDDFFMACVKHCLHSMEEYIGGLTGKNEKLLDYARNIVYTAQSYAKEHADYIRLYHEITCNGNRMFAKELASDIEGVSSKLYVSLVEKAKAEGNVRLDMDPAHFAFFFDNLMMMLQFSYACPYYSERYGLYAGKDILENESLLAEQLLLFLESAFTFESSMIEHH